MKIILKNIGAIGLSLLLHLYFYQSEHIEKFDYEFYDFINEISIHSKNSDDSFYTVIVDIDEKSLKELGQWPWPRVTDAQLIDKIYSFNPSSLGVNILFSEEDRLSPIHIQAFYQKFFDLNMDLSTFPQPLKDNDKLLAESIAQSDTTLAIYFNNNMYMDPHCQEISYKNNLFSEIKTEFNAQSLLCNHSSIQKGVENFGFINASTDSDGILRRIPLFMNYNQQTFPSFALATLLSFDSSINMNIEEDTILMQFSKNKPKVFSALDVLQGNVSGSEFQGKIVILGSSVVGLSATYITSRGEKISDSMIHAFTIDNILSNTFLTQPKIYKKINLVFSFLLTLLIVALLAKKQYVSMVILFLLTALFSTLWLFYSYINGVYISMGYLWMPLFYFFTASLFYHVRVLNQEKHEQEKFLVKQSKLASMGEMIAIIAHQWRQPLSAINGIVLNIDIDQRKKRLNAEQLDSHLNQIEDTTAYLSKTINDFTDFFSKNKRKDTFNIESLIRQTKQLSALSNQKDIQIIYRTEKRIDFIGYKSELIQSLLIILNNSIYACQRNPLQVERGIIYIDSVLVGKKLLISVEDNGGGIEPKELKKIFNPYFTTKEAQHGTGLGLYILKLIVEDSMNGKVSVRNGDLGAIFTIEIPTNG